MKILTQIARILRLIGTTFAHSAWAGVAFPHLSWPSKTAVVAAAVAVGEALYRQYFPAGKKGLIENLITAYQLVTKAAAIPPAPHPAVSVPTSVGTSSTVAVATVPAAPSFAPGDPA